MSLRFFKAPSLPLDALARTRSEGPTCSPCGEVGCADLGNSEGRCCEGAVTPRVPPGVHAVCFPLPIVARVWSWGPRAGLCGGLIPLTP